MSRGFPSRAPSRLAMIGIGVLVGLVLSELGVRVYAAVDHDLGRRLAETDPLGILVEAHGSIGYRQKPNKVFRYANGTSATSNGMGFRGPEVNPTKPPGVTRVVLLGGSTTHGWGVRDDETIDASMRRLLAQRFPGQPFEVVNLAFDAYDSNQLVERLRSDGIPLSPDLLIVNAGINDVYNARLQNLREDDPRTLFWQATLERVRREQERGRPYLRTLAKHYSYFARLVSVVRRRNQIAETESEGQAPNPEAANMFERNLRRIAQLAADHGMALLLSTPPSALRINFAPNARSSLSYWLADASATQAYRDTLAARMAGVAGELAAQGMRVAYLRADISPSEYLDDCHLTPDGNRALGAAFVDATVRLLDAESYWRPHAPR